MAKDQWDDYHQKMLEQDFNDTGTLRKNPYSKRTTKDLEKKYGANPFKRSRSDKGE